MTIHVIITAFNHPSYLAECVHSLVSQTYSNFVATIIDDCSTEDPFTHITDVLKKDDRFSTKRNEINKSGPISFMEEAASSNAEFIMWIHHDDWLHSKFLELTHQALCNNSNCTFAYSLCSRVIDNVARDEFPSSIRPELETGIHDISYDCTINCWIMWSSALIRRSSYVGAGGLESLYQRHERRMITNNYRKGESDLYIFAKLSALGPVYVINERLCYYRDHIDSNTNSATLKSTHIQDNVRTYDYIFDDIEFFPEDIRIISKINSVARLLTNQNFAVTALSVLFEGKFSREIKVDKNKVVSKLILTMERFIRDSINAEHKRIFGKDDIQLLKSIFTRES